ncbi:hypothetical protein THAOC_18472, partial [Thalassiosira oceanica]
LHYLNHDRKGKRLGSKAICARFKTFVDAGLIRGETLRLFVEAYRSSKLNKGHRKVDGRETHHSPSSEQIKCTDDLVTEWCENGGWFDVQAGGNANTRTNKDGSKFDPDAMHGKEIIFVQTVRVRGKKGMGPQEKSITHRGKRFRKERYLPGIALPALTHCRVVKLPRRALYTDDKHGEFGENPSSSAHKRKRLFGQKDHRKPAANPEEDESQSAATKGSKWDEDDGEDVDDGDTRVAEKPEAGDLYISGSAANAKKKKRRRKASAEDDESWNDPRRRNLTAEPEEDEGVPLPPFPADRVKIVSHDAALIVAEGTTIQLNSVSTRSAPALSLPPRSFALGSAADGTPTIVVSTRQEECGNVYLEGPTEVCSEAVAALPDELQSIYRDIDKLDEQRARCEERYMIVRLPQIKKPSPSALAGATSSEVEQVRLHFVDIQRRLLFAAICTLDQSFDACCAKLVQETREKIDSVTAAGGHELSFQSMYCPPGELNPKQLEKRDEGIGLAEKIVRGLDEAGCVTTYGGGYEEGDLDYGHPANSINNKNTHNYYKIDERDGADRPTIKGGTAFSGRDRLSEYQATEGKAAEDEGDVFFEPDPQPEPELGTEPEPEFENQSAFVSAIDYDNLPVEAEAKAIETLLEGIKKLTFDEHPETVRQCVMLELYGIPIGTQFIFWSLIKEHGECLRRGGAIHVQGWLKRVLMLFGETGIPLVMKPRGLIMTGQLNELFGSRTTSWALLKMSDIASADQRRKATMPAKVLEKLSAGQIQAWFICTWSPGVKVGNEAHALGTPIIADKTFGSNWGDTIRGSPVELPSNGAEMYGRGVRNHNFSDDKLRDSMDEKDGIFWNVTLNGGYVVADRDVTSMTARGGKPMVDYIQETFIGDQGETWEIVEKFHDVTTLVMTCPDEELRQIDVIGCPGGMIDTNPDVKHDDAKITAMGMRSVSWQHMHNWVETARQSPVLDCDAPPRLGLDCNWLDGQIEDNFVFTFSSDIAHNRLIAKKHIRHCVLQYKNSLLGCECNLNEPERNGYGRIVISSGPLVGANTRRAGIKLDRQLGLLPGKVSRHDAILVEAAVDDADDDRSIRSDEGWPEDDDELDGNDGDLKMPAAVPVNDKPPSPAEVIRDNKMSTRMFKFISSARPGDLVSLKKSIGKALHYLNNDRKGKRLGSKAICARFKTFVDSGLIRGETLRLFVDAYRSTKLNKGHRKVDGRESHHSPSSEQIKCTDDLVTEWCENRGWFDVQAGGNANTRTNKDGSKFDPDDMDGKEIIFVQTVRVRGKKGMGPQEKSITHRDKRFRKDRYLPGIALPALTQRFREGKEEGAKTKKAKAKKFLEYELEVDRTVCNANSSNGSVYPGGDNNLFVARVRIVKKKTKKKKTKK